MNDLLLWSGIFVLSLTTLIVSADFFIRAAERVGLSLGIPAFIVGVTIIAIGTSLPEMVTNIIAVIDDTGEIVSGNVIGSNITNICLVLGVIGFFAKNVKLDFDIMQVDVPMLIGATAFLGISLHDLHFSLFEAILALVLLGVYLAYIIDTGRSATDLELERDEESEQTHSSQIRWKEPLILIISAYVIYQSASYNVKAIKNLGSILDVPNEVIALTAVAFGTSLPELIVSVVAVRKGFTEMAIGNIMGSNVFNIFAVMGVPALFGDIVITPLILKYYNLPLVIMVTLLAFLIIKDKIINRWEGGILLMLYVFYLFNQVISML